MPDVTLVDADVFSGAYQGADQGADHKPLHIVEGETVEVSEEKAEQLLHDFPDAFHADGHAPKARRTRKPAGK